MRRFVIFLTTALFALLIIMLGMTNVNFSKNTVDDSPKYIFLFIGDGFSYPQMTLASLYKTSVLGEDDLIMKSFICAGNAFNTDGEYGAAESAGAVSAMASGIKTNKESLNVDLDGNKYETIAEKLKSQRGYRIGIISSDNLNHATPAGFYAHQSSRYNGVDIVFELIDSGFDYFGGADITGKYTVENIKEKPFTDFLSEKGYKYINAREDIESLTSIAIDGKVIAISPVLDPYATIPYAIDKEKYANTFTIAEHTKKCAEFLYGDGKSGFFIMVEGAKIDWACHANDAATVIHEVINFDNAIKEAVEFYNKHPKETLIIVTGDHETGGLSIGKTETTTNLYLHHLKNQTISFTEFSFKVSNYRYNELSFEEILLEIKQYFGIEPYNGENPDFYLSYSDIEKLRAAYDISMMDPLIRPPLNWDEYTKYGFYDPITTTALKAVNEKAGISWSTYSHSGLSVPVYALGNGEKIFMGFYQNTDIFFKLKELMKLK